ncbi:sugar-binding transcriptional regulator [Pseudoclavibacter helvolus]|uniref:sugar-binding transcriptional regulator n=1 Tax=Pseudoclavibacter helvolus TaxID=255205 RepID=UPI003C78B8B4
MPAPRNAETLVRAARLYYLDGLSQSDVATALGVSRASVSRILSAARDQGIVEIRIHDPHVVGRVGELEQQIVDAFGVTSAVVVTAVPGRHPLDVVAGAAAEYFAERVPSVGSVGLSWGKSIDAFVEQIHVESTGRALTLCPLVGGMPFDSGPAGNTALERLSQKSGAKAFRFESPAVVESPQTWAALTRESSISSAIKRATDVQLAFVGIGSYGLHASRHIVSAMRLSDAERAELDAQHPVGDICGRFFDATGQALGSPVSERVIGITLEQLAAIPEVVGFAAGSEKAPGVAGSLRTGALDSVILDEDLARALVEHV